MTDGHDLLDGRRVMDVRTDPAGPDGGGRTSLVADVTERLAGAGCVAADEEACELLHVAGTDLDLLEALVDRRVRGEPLAWITARTCFGGLEIGVATGVYVPRWQSMELARRGAERLPSGGAAVDLCTGSGAVALALTRARPRARVVASDVDHRAVACARTNGVEAYLGDLFGPIPPEFRGRTDVVVAVAPYVPTEALDLLPRDTLAFEDVALYDGGPDGTAVLRRIIAAAPGYLRPGGSLLLEIGGNQDEILLPELDRLGYTEIETWYDDDSDLRGFVAVHVGS